MGLIQSSTIILYVMQHPVPMRTLPLFNSSAGSTFGGNGAFTQDVQGTDASRLNLAVAGAAAGSASNLQANNTLTAFLEFDADF
jgi:hypothetical protein